MSSEQTTEQAEPARTASEGDDFRSVLYSVDRDGRRKWLYVHVFAGLWRRRRQLLAWPLVLIYLALPFLHIGDNRLVFIDIPNRQYTILGHVFWPQDAMYLILLALMGIVGTLLMISLFGRVFCGWLCPHNAYLEFVFRPIETFFEGKAARRKRQDKGPLTPGLAMRKLLKHLTFIAISWALANTFIALFLPATAHAHDFIGFILIDPSLHPAAFTTWLFALGTILFNFAWFREQTCTIVCPYGRFQAVMLDSDTLTVAYDSERGEPRGKKSDPEAGDCLDCGACQAVCPTGIDIRNGNQLECIHCAACIDACDSIMLRAGRPPKLISYTSENALAGGKLRLLRGRGILYLVMFILLLILSTVLVINRADVQVMRLRDRNMAALATNGAGDSVIRKNFTLAMVNKTGQDIVIDLSLDPAVTGTLTTQFPRFTLEAAKREEVSVFIEVPSESFTTPQIHPEILVSYDGEVQDRVALKMRHP